ncbi:hypothetical protein ZHAS_00017721 [Anopheles sinensis]|uniref:Uncharacterized protein n=1 Tax=Anopheles sinensis TaxID=74873 RepID=A0A084WH23_ANOSI|nr:hypothetical protein ZHAS_00017721 [Anopheles sinensis]
MANLENVHPAGTTTPFDREGKLSHGKRRSSASGAQNSVYRPVETQIGHP